MVAARIAAIEVSFEGGMDNGHYGGCRELNLDHRRDGTFIFHSYSDYYFAYFSYSLYEQDTSTRQSNIH